MMKRFQILFYLIFSLPLGVLAQEGHILLYNSSFEGIPKPSSPPKGWHDCGSPNESPPDVQPFGGFKVTKAAQAGNTYLGLVTRENDTWEAVSQRLDVSFEEGRCYDFSIMLAKSVRYESATSNDPDKIKNFDQAVKLRIWAGNSYCDKAQKLDESPLISHEEWRRYSFKLKPDSPYKYIILEAYYKTPTLIAYNGNLLVDNASAITPCDQLLALDDPDTDPANTNVSPSDNNKKDPNNTSKKEPVKKDPIKNDPVVKDPVKTPKVIDPQTVIAGSSDTFKRDLRSEDLKEGQIFRIENLYFDADSTNFSATSHAALDELFTFMENNPRVVLEIGGHTNGLPTHEYCDNLSTKRARNVMNYLIRKGVTSRRVKYKGYGKREPIATNETIVGRKKNQRVEIKILSLTLK